MADYYRSDGEYLEEELYRLDILLRPMIIRLQSKDGLDGLFQGSCISSQEAEDLLGGGVKAAKDVGSNTPEIDAQIAETSKIIEAKLSRSREQGIDLHLPHLIKTFGLCALEKDAIMICAAPELDYRYQRIYGYLQDDLTKTHPNLGFILSLLLNGSQERMLARGHFLPHSPLIKWRILRHSGEQSAGPSLSACLEMDPDVLSYILGWGWEEKEDVDGEYITIPLKYLINEELESQIDNLASHFQEKREGICIMEGLERDGKRRAAQYISKKAGLGMMSIELQDLLAEGQDQQSAIYRRLRNARLTGSAAYLEGWSDLSPEQKEKLMADRRIFQALQDFRGLSFLAVSDPVPPDFSRLKGHFRITVPPPDYQMRKDVWGYCLHGEAVSQNGKANSISEEEMEMLANKFRFTSEQIQDAISWAGSRASLDGRSSIKSEDLHEGCRAMSQLNLSSLAVKVQPRYTWDDIILPPDRIRQLEKIKNHIRYRGLVYQTWGFEERLSLGKGLNVIFSGPSGTGKTMAAEVIARELGLDLYKIDLSMVVSKYIGETEKNLSRIFQEAERIDAILFFDEADALFGKRSEVKDAHDRYANLEISYLLQKMEEHQGIVVMATNLSLNMDDAFMRRMHFIVEFPFPDEGLRLNIWNSLLPEKAPRSDDINFEFLAKKFKLAGGNIKNIMVNAGFLAAEASAQSISMEHIIRATRDEMQKIGKVCLQSEFGEYKHLISN